MTYSVYSTYKEKLQLTKKKKKQIHTGMMIGLKKKYL